MATRGLLAKGEYWERLAIMGKALYHKASLIYRNTRSSLQQTWAKTSYHMQKIRDNAGPGLASSRMLAYSCSAQSALSRIFCMW
jgi:hypothetical protein